MTTQLSPFNAHTGLRRRVFFLLPPFQHLGGITRLTKYLGTKEAITRIMPNLPAQVFKGVTALIENEFVKKERNTRDKKYFLIIYHIDLSFYIHNIITSTNVKKYNMELIFIYNAQKGRLNSLIDYIHKTVSPGTYSCNLCAITHNFKTVSYTHLTLPTNREV